MAFELIWQSYHCCLSNFIVIQNSLKYIHTRKWCRPIEGSLPTAFSFHAQTSRSSDEMLYLRRAYFRRRRNSDWQQLSSQTSTAFPIFVLTSLFQKMQSPVHCLNWLLPSKRQWTTSWEIGTVNTFYHTVILMFINIHLSIGVFSYCNVVVLNCCINCYCSVMFTHICCVSSNRVSVSVSIQPWRSPLQAVFPHQLTHSTSATSTLPASPCLRINDTTLHKQYKIRITNKSYQNVQVNWQWDWACAGKDWEIMWSHYNLISTGV